MNWKKKFKTIRVGDKVVKARPYKKNIYCRHSGSAINIPIGSVGVVIKIEGEMVVANFDCCGRWHSDVTELDLA